MCRSFGVDVMKPFFENDRVVLFCGDSRVILPSLTVCDLLLTDPPYGNNYRSNDREVLGKMLEVRGDEDLPMVREILGLSWKKLKINRHGYIFGPTTPSNVVPMEVGGITEIIWNKSAMSGGNLSLPWGTSHEKIWFGVKRYVGKRAASTGNASARLRKGTVISCNRVGETSRTHPTQKPVSLLSQLVEMSSNIGETILDPFAGTGSSLIASILEGRKAIGIEIEEEYCRIAVEHISKATKLRESIEKFK